MAPSLVHDINPDDQLLKRLRDDDKEAFEIIYQRYWSVLFASAYNRVADKTLCQDIVQDIFLDIWRRRRSLQIKNLEAYLKSSVRFMIYRAISKLPLSSPYFEAFENSLISGCFTDDRILEREYAELLDHWIEALSPKKRKIFLLHFMDELSTQEIALQLGISRKTVQNQIANAYADIQKRYAHYLGLLLIITYFK